MDTTIPHSNASDLLPSEIFRSMFYFVTPWETMYVKASQVPDYNTLAFPYVTLMIILELFILCWKGKELRLNDKITCFGTGMYNQMAQYAGLKAFEYSMYAYVYNHYRVYELPWNSTWTWILTFFLQDFSYYWFHRMAHEVNLLWNTHQTHHSSEDYNLTTAIRLPATRTYGTVFFYLPAALFIPPSSFTLHRQLNFLYQFWIHTELVDSLGPLEYILNTPSHHRVHHGRNPYCIDKNYASVLIIWDRMFGTFQPERRDEKVVYGLVKPLNTFDVNRVQISPFVSFIKGFREHKSFTNKLKFVFYGPGWSPGKPRLGDFNDIPEIESPVKLYNPDVNRWISGYVLLHFMLCLSIYARLSAYHLSLPTLTIAGAIVYCLMSLTCFGYMFDKKSFAFVAEFMRCCACGAIMYWYGEIISLHLKIQPILMTAITTIYVLSAMIWFTAMSFLFPKREREKTS